MGMERTRERHGALAAQKEWGQCACGVLSFPARNQCGIDDMDAATSAVNISILLNDARRSGVVVCYYEDEDAYCVLVGPWGDESLAEQLRARRAEVIAELARQQPTETEADQWQELQSLYQSRRRRWSMMDAG